jgi:hypothetical protein
MHRPLVEVGIPTSTRRLLDVGCAAGATGAEWKRSKLKELHAVEQERRQQQRRRRRQQENRQDDEGQGGDGVEGGYGRVGGMDEEGGGEDEEEDVFSVVVDGVEGNELAAITAGARLDRVWQGDIMEQLAHVPNNW